jgi:hypothetical protein
MASDPSPRTRPRLNRAEQRFNYAIAVAAVAVIVGLTIASPRVVVGGTELPVLVVALLVAAFLFGLGQMVVGLTRRRRYLRDQPVGAEDPGTRSEP